MTTIPAFTAYVDPELYDLVYSWYTLDIPFYVEEARAAAGPVLELGCGTGRVMLPILEAGVDIDGLDLEPAMIEALRRKAQAKGLEPRLVVADMRHFTMPRRYALATIPFRAFMHLVTQDDQLRALRCIREHLEPGGALTLNLFYPNFAKMLEYEERRVCEREFPHPRLGHTVSVWNFTHYDRVRQLLRVEREVLETADDGRIVARHAYGFRVRWIFRFEMELLLEAAGFTRIQVLGGFDRRPLAHTSDEMVWTAWRD